MFGLPLPMESVVNGASGIVQWDSPVLNIYSQPESLHFPETELQENLTGSKGCFAPWAGSRQGWRFRFLL